MCRCEMLDVGNFHSGKEKVTGSFRSSGGGHGGQELEDRRKLRGESTGHGVGAGGGGGPGNARRPQARSPRSPGRSLFFLHCLGSL